jgi:hypothetical protein
MLVGPDTGPQNRPWQEAALGIDADRLMIQADPRVGKTLYGARWLRSLTMKRNVTRMLVTAPIRVCPSWATTLEMVGLPVIPAYKMTVSTFLAQHRSGWEGVVVINPDKVWNAREALYRHTQAYVADEVHDTASPSSHRGMVARGVAERASFVRTLTATPIRVHRGNHWSPLHMVRGWPGSWTSFMEHFTIRDTMFPSIIKSYINAEEHDALLRKHGVTITRSSVFGADHFTTVIRDVELPPRAAALYRMLAREWVIEEPGLNLVADHTVARIMRLQQITSGFALDQDRDEYELLHTAKIDALIGDLSDEIEADEKSVIFYRFVAEGELAHTQIANAYPTVPLFRIDGRQSIGESERNRAAFQDQKGPAIILVQVQAGGAGIELSAGQHAKYLSRDFSFINDEQSRNRIYAPGEVRTLTYYEVPGTIDKTLSRMLSKRRELHETVRAVSKSAFAFGEED